MKMKMTQDQLKTWIKNSIPNARFSDFSTGFNVFVKGTEKEVLRIRKQLFRIQDIVENGSCTEGQWLYTHTGPLVVCGIKQD